MIKFLDTAGKAVTDALDFIIEKNKIKAQVNRLRLVMRKENNLMDSSYKALGKYYYEHLKDTDNAENKKICATIDKSKARMEKARLRYNELMEKQLSKLNNSAVNDYAYEDNDDITVCCSYDE